MATEDISGLFFGPSGAGGNQTFMGGDMTAWDGATYTNTVTVGSVTYTNIPVVNPTGLTTGLVLLAFTPAGPIVLGQLFKAA